MYTYIYIVCIISLVQTCFLFNHKGILGEIARPKRGPWPWPPWPPWPPRPWPACSRQDRCQSLRQTGVQIKLPLSQVLTESAMVGYLLGWYTYLGEGHQSIVIRNCIYIYRMPMMLGFWVWEVLDIAGMRWQSMSLPTTRTPYPFWSLHNCIVSLPHICSSRSWVV